MKGCSHRSRSFRTSYSEIFVSAHTFLGNEPWKHCYSRAKTPSVAHFKPGPMKMPSFKQLTSFSDFRLRDEDSNFVSAERYVKYLHEYCDKFKLWSQIKLSTTVVLVKPNIKGKGHTITYSAKGTGKQKSWTCDAIAACSGLHVTPNLPEIPGLEDHVPLVMHSSQFKSRSQFGTNKTIMVLGSGETGADIAYLAVTSPTKQVVMCHRSGFHFAPKSRLVFCPWGYTQCTLTVPLDNARASLFDTAYVHPLLRNSNALWTFYDWYVKGILWLNTGTSGGFDQIVGEPSPEKNHVSKIFFNKSSKASPYISYPYRLNSKRSLVDRIRSDIIQSPVPSTNGRQIGLAPWPESVSSDGEIHFQDNGRPKFQRVKDGNIKPDIVICCIGYKQTFPFLDRDHYPTAEEANRPNSEIHGFLRPSLGAIPPLAEMQAQLWILSIMVPERVPELRPEDEPHYRARIAGSDMVTIMRAISSIGYNSAVGFAEIVKRSWERREWRLAIAWALGVNVNPKFRSRGPWRCDGPERLLETEVWETMCRRRWFFDHFLLSFLPMAIFGSLSLACSIYAMLYHAMFDVVLAVCEHGPGTIPSARVLWVEGKLVLHTTTSKNR
ncbi:LOW QUALITY PROTEIN: hypothetical protein QC761_700450 [Podospora bellae-mahoneyi]|uniref:Monooxygenase n=1 Tax=Podospora bellae-mahoneyi TaxID=2093777 RepID=A0ABR0FAH7_9PEZI|nr:LOW QUALITY PROTEIN: hypothetical protein QC761_700450 [Podospora bellae-mahoneyi]